MQVLNCRRCESVSTMCHCSGSHAFRAPDCEHTVSHTCLLSHAFSASLRHAAMLQGLRDRQVSLGSWCTTPPGGALETAALLQSTVRPSAQARGSSSRAAKATSSSWARLSMRPLCSTGNVDCSICSLQADLGCSHSIPPSCRQ